MRGLVRATYAFTRDIAPQTLRVASSGVPTVDGPSLVGSRFCLPHSIDPAMPRLSPPTYQRVTLVALIALCFIVVSGAAVRLTGSGLGCPDWPTCAEGQVIAPLEYNAMIEFVNRMVTGVVSVAVILAVLGSLVRTPRRRDLTLLSLGLVAGVLAQIVWGGLVVLSHLYPPLVIGHFLISMALLLNAAVLHHRAGQPDGVPEPVVEPRTVRLLRGLVVAAGIVIVLGTIVSGSGPHSGSHDGEIIERLPFAVEDVARLHGIAVIAFLGLTLIAIRSLRVTGAPRYLLRRAEVLLAVLVAQAAVGYTQYFTGVPPLLVGVHIAGAVAVWLSVVRLNLGTTQRVASAGTAPAVGAATAMTTA